MLVLWSALLSLVAAAPAVAESATTAEPTPSADSAAADEFSQVLARGLAAYEAGQYLDALDAFDRAWAIRKVPRLRYNSARCLERLGRRAEALEAYRAFVALPDTTAEERIKAKGQIEALERELQPPPALVAPAPAPESGHTLSWVLFGTGVAGTAAAVGLGVLTRSTHAEFEAAADVATKSALASEGRRSAIAADIALGAAVACVVAGVITWFVEASP